MYARFLTAGVLLSYVLVLGLGALLWGLPVVRNFLSGAVLLTFSFVAVAASLTAWRTLPRPGNRVWLLFGIAALLSALSFLAEFLPKVGGARSNAIHMVWLASYAFFLGAVVVAIHQSERGRVTELALDVALIITAAAVVIVRWAPGPYVASMSPTPNATAFLTVFGPVTALSALLIVAVLLSGPEPTIARPALNGILGAVICFTLSVIPQVVNGGACCHAGSWTTFAAIGTWAFIGYAGVSAAAAGELAMTLPSGERLRRWVAPTVAIVLATVSVEAAVNPPLGRRTALALGILGALVAMRLTELLNATRLQVVERRELAQTRALVEVSRALAGKNDLDTTLRIVTQWAVRVLNARAASVELLSNDAKTLVLRAAEGLPDETIGMTFPVDSSYTGWVILNGEARVTANPSRDPFISARSLKHIGDSPLAAVPLRYRERLLGVLTCIGNRPFDAADLDLLRAFANQTALALEDARLFEQVRALSITDPLTGLANRRQLDRELSREFAAAQRGRRLVAVMFDLDDFKQHNDKYGHVAGDEALKHFAEALQTMTRTMNLAARYGGDEFLALLADSDARGAEIFINRVKDRFRRSMDGAGWPVLQVSAGLAEYITDMKNPEDLILATDRALYAEKFESDVSA